MKKISRWFAVFSLVGLLLGSGPVAAQLLWQTLVHGPRFRETGKFLTPVAGGFVMVGETDGGVAVAVPIGILHRLPPRPLEGHIRQYPLEIDDKGQNMVHPTKAYLASWIARIFSLKNSWSRNPYACRFIVLILLFVPSKGPVLIG